MLPADCKLLAHKLFRGTSIRLKALREQHAKTPDDAEVKKLLDDYEKSSNRPDEKDLSDAQHFVISALSE